MRGTRASALVVATLLAAVASPGASALAATAEPAPVLFIKHGSLWLRAGDAKGAAQQLAALPGALGTATALQADPAGNTVLVGSDRGWFWSPLRRGGAISAPTLRKLACAAGPATLSSDGASVLCATLAGTATVIQLATGKQLTRSIPIERAAIAGAGSELRLIWSDEHGLWSAPLADPKAVRQLATEPPLRGLSVSPTGERAVGVFEGPAHHGKTVVTQEMLFGFALDGRAVRRKAIQKGQALSWSADGSWVLVQDDQAACIMAAVGGQYKCWKGYRGAALAADGRWALLLGNRDDKPAGNTAAAKKGRGDGRRNGKDKDKDKDRNRRLAAAAPRADKSSATSAELPAATAAQSVAHANSIDAIIESIEGSADDPDSADGDDADRDDAEGDETEAAASTTTGELHLYRADLDGAFTLPPTRLEPSVDGPAVFLRPEP